MSLQNSLGNYEIAAQEDRSAARTRIMIPAQVRASGAVQTFRHWPEQPGSGPLPKAEVIDLTGEA